MKQIKTFIDLLEDNSVDHDEVNEFLRHHNILKIKTEIIQGFTYTSENNYVTSIDTTIKPSLVTTVFYEVEK